MSTFDSTKLPLTEILGDIVKGKIQLPDFQRGWIWDDEHVRSLLVSIARSFPVGAVMLLETGGDARFQVRPIENVPFAGTPPQAEMLILDGQQRLTTLTQVLALDGTVKTRNDKGKPIERYYYFNIRKALEGHESLDEALIAIEPDRKLKENFGRDVQLDLSNRELECQQLYFPCREILNSNDWEKCLYQVAKEHFDIWMEFREKVKRLEGSSGSSIDRFYTEDDHLFYVDGRTYALTKMWGRRSLPTVNDLIIRCGLSHVKYAAMTDGVAVAS